MQIQEEIYKYAADYLRVADPNVRELTIDLAIRSGMNHASRYTSISFTKERKEVQLTVGQQEVTIFERYSRNIRIADRNKKVLARYPDDTGRIVLNSVVCDCCSRDGSATLSYEFGISKISEMPASVLMGIMKYVAYIYENRGDQNQLNFGKLNDALSRSGALSEWRPLIRKVD